MRLPPDACPLFTTQTTVPATARFQLALPYVLAPVSPALAALHAGRARNQLPAEPTLRLTHCAACGASYLDGGGSIRSVRSRKKRMTADGKREPKRFMRMSCGVCGYREDTPVEHSGASAFPPLTERRDAAGLHSATEAQNFASTSIQVAAVSASSAIPSQPNQPEALACPSPTTQKTTNPASPADTVPSVPYQRPRLHFAPSSRPSPKPSPVSSVMQASSTATARTKARAKKPVGLQAVLARNREKQEQEKKYGRKTHHTKLDFDGILCRQQQAHRVWGDLKVIDSLHDRCDSSSANY
ncbi:uncharacterized protein LAESUDRAFT_892 [Laetiporus sulphureus 93-53]|uniref:Rpr2-domain-containing protein n=1 Tax=Laetiporus sulphureus 93-53 TaxID=1314785 RepID=A0A165I1G4_9APHY|nr:uncharacterized protein LAESUDRAFT_892 [Laetiporus sulphureus 93-53]KZT12468.1 hypothetical protein LAESUDRAFT_892 [Laetiporus sulphureus 93-53]